MKLSVIIPIYNEEKVIVGALESLDKQSYPDFEIIVVDDGSTDKTLEVLRNLQLTINSLQILEQNHKGTGAARNLAAKKARGNILVFVDADMLFETKFLSMLVKPIVAGKAKGTFSKYEYVANWNNLWARCWNINEDWEKGRRHPKGYPDTQKVFRAILKSEFLRVGGFTPGGYNDDWSLFTKLGYEAVSAPGAIFYHKNPATLVEVFKQARWVGKRPYKLGFIGSLFALVRASLPVSIIIGITKAVLKKAPEFILFKVVYDFGIVLGILTALFNKRLSK